MNLLKKLWAAEPVLVATILPLAVTVGVLTTDQASTVANIIAGVVAAAAQILAAFGIRSQVSPSRP